LIIELPCALLLCVRLLAVDFALGRDCHRLAIHNELEHGGRVQSISSAESMQFMSLIYSGRPNETSSIGSVESETGENESQDEILSRKSIIARAPNLYKSRVNTAIFRVIKSDTSRTALVEKSTQVSKKDQGHSQRILTLLLSLTTARRGRE